MNGQKTAVEIGTEVHEALLRGVSVTFDGGKTFEEAATITTELWDLIVPLQTNSPGFNKQIQVYASAALSGTFHLKPKKPRKVRQAPPFWSAYR